jgi:Zn-dependent protease with chaperone function
MTGTAIGLLVLGVLLAEPVSRALAAARWPARDPVGALLLWQAVGLAGGLALVGSGLTYGLGPLGPTLPAAARAAAPDLLAAAESLGWTHRIALLVAAALAARLIGVLVRAVWHTLRTRRRHLELLDLVASPAGPGTPWPSLPGARVLDHPVPVAYCLPGLGSRGSRLVLSSGALDTLTPDELAAVVAHERAHLRERHDLVVLPFVAWGACAPWVPGMLRAQQAVATLVEMRADDAARALTGADALTAALHRVRGAPGPAVLPPIGTAVDARIARVSGRRPAPLPAPARVAVRLAALALVAVPTVLLLSG